MNSKLLIGLAMAAGLLCVAQPVTAQDYVNHVTKVVPLDFGPVDSSSVLVGDKSGVSKINDSLFFFSERFEAPTKFNRIVADFVCVTKDTATATGFSRDSVTIMLEARNNQDSIKIWHVIGTTTKWPLAAWDSTGLATLATIFTNSMNDYDTPVKAYPGALSLYTGAGTGVGGPYRGISSARIAVAEADSAAAFGDEFRFVMLHSAAEDSAKSHCVLKSSSTIDILSKLNAIVRFYRD